MPYTTPVAGTAITVSWETANVRDQVISQFADAATRDAAVGAGPVEGMHADLADVDYLTRYDGARWLRVAPYLVATKASSVDVTSTGVEVALGSWNAGDATVTFYDGHLYRLELLHRAYNSGTAGQFFDNLVQVRATVNSTVAQSLGSWRVAAGGGSSPIVAHTSVSYVRNQSGSDLGKSLGLTVTKSTGGNAILGSGAQLYVWDLGLAVAQTSDTLAAMAPVSIT